MKLLSEKLKGQIDEAKSIAEKENAEAQAIASADDVDPAKAIAAIEKSQSKAKAAELVIKNLEPKLAAALKAEDKESYDQKKAAVKKTLQKYVDSLPAIYADIDAAIDQYRKAQDKLKAASAKVLTDVREPFNTFSMGPHGRDFFEIPIIENMLHGRERSGNVMQHPDQLYNYLHGAFKKNLEQKQGDVIDWVLSEGTPRYEKEPEPAPVVQEPAGPMVYRPQVRDQSETPQQIRERLGMTAAYSN